MRSGIRPAAYFLSAMASTASVLAWARLEHKKGAALKNSALPKHPAYGWEMSTEPPWAYCNSPPKNPPPPPPPPLKFVGDAMFAAPKLSVPETFAARLVPEKWELMIVPCVRKWVLSTSLETAPTPCHVRFTVKVKVLPEK